jgi:hypothetical protein
MGPHQYETIWLQESFFASGEKAVKNIQDSIDAHVAEGWELFECHPISTAMSWQWTMLIFRRPNREPAA